MRYLIALAAMALAGCSTQAASAPANNQPVLVELYTSQGCSSCPPADRVLSTLGHKGSVAGVPVIPLAYHVDYWNYLGWRDPLSSSKWSERQRVYARAVASGRVYTPQLIVDGRSHVVGSDRRKVANRVRAAAAARKLGVSAKLTRARGTVDVAVSVPKIVGRRDVDIVVALYENEVTTRVSRGENKGRVLRNDYIVRRLKRFGPTRTVTARFKLEPSWRSAKLGAVAFVRERKSLAVIGAVRATPEP